MHRLHQYNLRDVLSHAQKKKYAVGAFNVNNLEFAQGVLDAANELKSPVILSTSQGAIAYAGLAPLHAMLSSLANSAKVPIVIHLDHGRDETIIRDCIRQGYSSVMYDGSHLPFEKNISHTKKIVAYASRHDVSVEGELGTIGGAEDAIRSRHIQYTDPLAAKEFVERTGIDALAVAIGTSHGIHKFVGTQHINIALLSEIRRNVSIPLVLHGASSIPPALVRQANKYGASLDHATGVLAGDIKRAIAQGVCKVNEDSDLRLAFLASVRKTLQLKCDISDPREVLRPAREAIAKMVAERIRILGSGGRA